MKNEDEVKEYFKRKGTVAKWWNPTKGDYSYLFQNQLNIIKDWVQKENKNCCLEVSCGKGRATMELEFLFKNYLATDISNEMLSLTQENCQFSKFMIQDAENLSIKTESQDCVICLEALVHYPNPQNAIKEFYRVLKPGGALIIDSDNKYSARRLVKKGYQILEGSKKQFGQEIFQPYTKKDLMKWIKSSGFEIEIFRYMGVISPITLHTKEGEIQTLINDKISKKIQMIDKIPLIKRFGTYHLILSRK
ncbi:MAG: methyltransferase domain-containing protein [Candidatus Woesearchaeota archaeon]